LLLRTWSFPVNQQRQQSFLVSGEPEPLQSLLKGHRSRSLPINSLQDDYKLQTFTFGLGDDAPVIAAVANIYSHPSRGASIHFAKTCGRRC
jgi:hypothetical protein